MPFSTMGRCGDGDDDHRGAGAEHDHVPCVLGAEEHRCGGLLGRVLALTHGAEVHRDDHGAVAGALRGQAMTTQGGQTMTTARVNFGNGQVNYAGSLAACRRYLSELRDEYAGSAFLERRDPETGDWYAVSR